MRNFVLLCDRHHHLVHDSRWRVERTDDNTIKWYTPEGDTYRIDTS